MASWRDMSTPLNPQAQDAAPAPDPAPSAPTSGGSWKDMSTPLKPPPAAAAAAPAAPAASASAPPQSWGDYLLNHLAGAGQTLSDTSRVASDAATFGLVDKLFGKQAQDDTAAAYQRLGYGAIPFSLAGGLATGGPELKAASAIGEAAAPYVGKWAGGVLGSAAVGAPSAGLSAYGHEAGWTPDAGDIGKAAAIGGGVGALGAVPGGVVGRGGTLPAASTSADLKDAATQAYKPLSDILYDATKEVHPALDPIDAQNALRDWSGYKWGDASKTSKEINTLLDKPQLSANDLQQSQSYLKGIARDGRSDANDALYAAHYAGKLQDVLDNATPQTGVPQNWSNPTNAPSFASATKAEGDTLHGRAQDMARLENWQQRAAVTGGPDVAGQAKSFLTSPEGQKFAPPPAPGAPPSSAPAYSALNTLAGTAAKPSSIPWAAKHFVIAPIVGGLAKEGLDAATGEQHQSPLARIGEDLAVGGALGVGTAGYSGISGQLARAAQNRAIAAARSTLSTGNYAAPLQPQTPVRDALRMLLMGQGAAGNY